MSQIRGKYSTVEAGKIPGVKKLRLLHKNIMARCYYKKHHAYHNYGARGIYVIDAWHTRDVFIEWALQFGDDIWLTLDRINVNGPYAPDNCRWVTLQAQLNNTRRNRRLTFNGRTQNIFEWAIELGIESSTIHKRLSYGLPIEKVLHQGPIKHWKHGTRAGYEGHNCRCDLCTKSNTLRHQKARQRRKLNAALP